MTGPDGEGRMLDEDREAGSASRSPAPTATPRAAPTRVRFLVLFAACSLAVVTYIHRVGFATASTPIRDDLGLNQRHLGLLMAAFMVAYGVAEVPWGLIGDRKGVRNPLAVIILGGSLTTAALAAVAWLPDGAGLAARGPCSCCGSLFGAFQAGTFPSITRMLADWMPTTERGGAQGLLWMSSRIGGAAAPLLLVPLFGRFGSWEAPLVLVAGLGVALVRGLLALVPEPARGDAVGQRGRAAADRLGPRRRDRRATARSPGDGC